MPRGFQKPLKSIKSITCRYTHESAFHLSDLDSQDLIRRVERDSVLNCIKSNHNKKCFLLPGYRHEIMYAKVG